MESSVADKFTLTGGPAGYAVSAVPVAYNVTGTRTFYSEQNMAVRENTGPEPAPRRAKQCGRTAHPPGGFRRPQRASS